jgi:acetamidase/formamidase family protein
LGDQAARRVLPERDDNTLNRRIGTAGGEPAFLRWDIGDGVATNQFGFRLSTAPFLGILGTARDEPGEHSTIPPRTGNGGNIDCKELVAGSTVYLPVTVAGACCFSRTGMRPRSAARPSNAG